MASDFQRLYITSAKEVLTQVVYQDIKAFVNILSRDLKSSDELNAEFAPAFVLMLRWMLTGGVIFSPGDVDILRHLLEILKPALPAVSLETVASLDLQGNVQTLDSQDIEMPDGMGPARSFTLQDLQTFLTPSLTYPATPPRHGIQGVLESNSISPPTAILRSPTSSLSKTYAGDSFRQARQVSNRQVCPIPPPRSLTSSFHY